MVIITEQIDGSNYIGRTTIPTHAENPKQGQTERSSLCLTVPRIPLIDDLTISQIPSGSNILVEFDPASQWYNASITIAAGWIRSSGKVQYNVSAQPPERIRSVIEHLGLDAEKIEREGSLRISDWYTATLGRKSREKFARNSLKVAELSIDFAKEDLGTIVSLRPDWLFVMDSTSTLARFNEEKSWVEFMLTRSIPAAHIDKSRFIHGLLTDVHSQWACRQLEAAHDGIVDFKIEEEGKTTRNLVRIRSMRDVGFDKEWHELRVRENFEVALIR